MPSSDLAAFAPVRDALAPMPLDLLRCPVDGGPLTVAEGDLRSARGHRYRVSHGIAMFAEAVLSPEAAVQKGHYDAIAAAYEANLAYPHTQAYFEHLDDALIAAATDAPLGTVAEICCGMGEAFSLFKGRYQRGIGVDISPEMLVRAATRHAGAPVTFVQGDATRLPLADGGFDTVFMLGGIHHVNDRVGLFREVARILKPGGRFVFREPVSDLLVWRALRAVIYRWSPMLDHETERPLRRAETEQHLAAAGLATQSWRTYGFLGFCLFMNSDVLVFNRLFQFVPGIAAVTRLAARIDRWTLRLPGLADGGLQAIGVARRPA